MEAYDFFRPFLVLALLTHVVGLLPQWHRYVGPAFDSGTFLRTKRRSTVAFFAVSTATAVSLLPAAGFFILPALFFLWYLHYYRRFFGLHRGAGAVGFVPMNLAAFIFFSDLSRSLAPGETGLQIICTLAYAIHWSGILLNSGLMKAREGYFRGYGIPSFLANPHWGRFWLFFNKYPLKNIQKRALGMIGVSAELAAGSLLLVAALGVWPSMLGLWSAILMILFFSSIWLFIKLYTLPWTSALIGLYFLAFFVEVNVTGGIVSLSAELLRDGGVLLGFFIISLWLFGATQITGAVGVLCETAGVRVGLLESKLANLFQIFRWRVFTYPVISSFVGWTPSLRNLPSVDEEYAASVHMNPLARLATESVVITSIFNTLKHPEHFHKFWERLREYLSNSPYGDSGGYLRLWVCIEGRQHHNWVPVFSVSTKTAKTVEIHSNLALKSQLPPSAYQAITAESPD